MRKYIVVFTAAFAAFTIFVIGNILFTNMARKSEKDQLWAKLRELQPLIMEAGNSPQALRWLRIACPEFMDYDQRLHRMAQEDSRSYISPTTTGRCQEVMNEISRR